MGSERLLSILLLLQAHGRMSARSIAERLETSERTVYRDFDALSAAGVPVYAERGRAGGLALMAGYRTDVSGLTAAEARALFVFAGRGTLKDLGLDRELRAALRKLMAALPANQRPEAVRAQERVVVDTRGWMRTAEALPWLPVVQQAVWSERRLRIAYRRAAGLEARQRTVEPYGLVSKAGTWYLIAADRGEPRLYRVSRIESAVMTAEPAARPARLDLEALWERLRQRVEERGAGVVVTLRVREARADMLLRICAPQLVSPARRSAPASADGWLRVELAFVAEGAALGTLLGFGTDLEVLAPASLRRSMGDTAREVGRLYPPEKEKAAHRM